MRVELGRLHERLGKTTIYVTHDQIEAMTMAHRIAVFNAGRVEQIGSPLELYNDPVNLFVAGFIGSPRMNFLSGPVHPADDSVSLQAFSQKLRLPSAQGLADMAELTIGVRPEHFGDCGA